MEKKYAIFDGGENGVVKELVRFIDTISDEEIRNALIERLKSHQYAQVEVYENGKLLYVINR